tara:strand:+ start:188 stop:466 length:279 start_codon:yes stop_codon:yes gene_type:complete
MTTDNKDLVELTGGKVSSNGNGKGTEDIDKLIQKEMKQAAYREDYNKKPEVIERRRVYNANKNKENQIVRMVIKGEISKEEGQKRLAAVGKS